MPGGYRWLAVKCYRCKTEPPRHFLRARSVTPLQVAQKERRNPRGIILANKRTIKTTQVTTAPRNKVSSGSSGKIERFVNVRYVNNHRPDDVMVARCWSSRLSPEFLPLVSVLATLYDPGNHIGAETQPEILLSEQSGKTTCSQAASWNSLFHDNVALEAICWPFKFFDLQ
jgi:hypothetical protein